MTLRAGIVPLLALVSVAPLAPLAAQTDFQRQVVPLLGRLGCSAAKCHGSFQGKGGFRLSLFGYDFKSDHEALLAKGSKGDRRRVNLEDPEQSLILLKPTKQMRHKGGKRFEKDSAEYRDAAPLDPRRREGRH